MSKEKINQRAVENFLGSLDVKLNIVVNFGNMMRDSRIYKWNHETITEISKSIAKAYGR